MLQLVVTALIPIESQPQPGWGVWPDVCEDDRVSYMEQRIADRQPFTKRMWPGGDTSEPRITFPTVVEVPVRNRSVRLRKPHGKNLKLRQTNMKAESSRKQRRISSYFSRSTATNPQQEQILGILSELLSNYSELLHSYKSLHKLLIRRKRRPCSKRSSFHSLLTASKTCTLSGEGCQTGPSATTRDAGANPVVSTFHQYSY